MSEEIKKFIINDWGQSKVIEKKYPEYHFSLNYNFDNECSCIKGMLYYLGILGYPKDELKAKELYEQAIEKNSCSYAMTCLGSMYHNGDNVPQDYLKAKELFEQASKLGNPYAMSNLGDLYYYGHGVPQDYLKTKELCEKAIKLGSTSAINCLAHLYENGYGVPKDELKAKELLEQSIELGNSNAMNKLGNMYKYGNGVPKDESKAIELYEQAILLGNYDNISVLKYNISNEYIIKLIKIKKENKKLKEEIDEYIEREVFKPKGIGAEMIQEHLKKLQEELNNPK